MLDAECAERGGTRTCPFISAAGFDAPLTCSGQAAARRLGTCVCVHDVGVSVWVLLIGMCAF